MRKEKYIVVGRYDSERNSWIPDGDIRHVCSGHRSESAAWTAAPKHHKDLGGCDGSDMLTKVFERWIAQGSPKGTAFLKEADETGVDYYIHENWIYVECDFWSAHEIIPIPGGLGYRVKGGSK